jgi:hypothetical protein
MKTKQTKSTAKTKPKAKSKTASKPTARSTPSKSTAKPKAEHALKPDAELEAVADRVAEAVFTSTPDAVFAAFTGSDAPAPMSVTIVVGLFRQQQEQMRGIQLAFRDIAAGLLAEGRNKDKVRALLKGLWAGYQRGMIAPSEAAVSALEPLS